MLPRRRREIENEHLSAEKIKLLEGASLLDPYQFDEAIMDVYKLPSGEYVAVYDWWKIIEEIALIQKDPRNEEGNTEAIFHFYSVTLGTIRFMKSRTPIILRESWDDDQIEADFDDQYLMLDGKKWYVVECPYDLPDLQHDPPELLEHHEEHPN